MPDVPAIDAESVDETHLVLDVREDDEWRAGHVEGALHIPVGQLISRLAEVPSDRHVVAVCRVGARSEQATAYLVAQGRSVRNLTGGMHAWAGSGRPMVSETGTPPAVI